MLHATLELARRIDRAEIDFCALAAGAGRDGGVASLEIAGGRALRAAEGSPLNKVLGLGLGVPVSDSDLDAIEAFYDEHGVPVQIELCPLASPGVAARLTARGYQLQGFENQLARPLNGESVSGPGGFRIESVSGGLDEVWLRVVAEAFAAGEGPLASHVPPPADAVETLTRVMRGFVHPEFERFLVWAGDEPAGGGCAYTIGGVRGVTGTATLPAFRRRGVQQAVVAHALNSAGGRADVAMTTTDPGSTSQRTFERFGFQVIYTRAIFVLS
jgi:ribosomal protein S18 acetylase RimI-like enzyme